MCGYRSYSPSALPGTTRKLFGPGKESEVVNVYERLGPRSKNTRNLQWLSKYRINLVQYHISIQYQFLTNVPCQTSSVFHPAYILFLDIWRISFTLVVSHSHPHIAGAEFHPPNFFAFGILLAKFSKIFQLTIYTINYIRSLFPIGQVSASDNKLKASSERQAAKEALYVTIVACILCWWRRRLKDSSFDLLRHCLLQGVVTFNCITKQT